MEAKHGIDSMTQTAENLAREHGIERADQDAYALRSQQRAERARANGWLAEEIVPVPVKAGKETPRRGPGRAPPARDDARRPRPRSSPSSGPGRRSRRETRPGINDGAGALLAGLGGGGRALRPRAARPRHRAWRARACLRARWASGPCRRSASSWRGRGGALADYDVIEINEAFAAQVLACTRALGLPDDADFVNPNGGAIALGHPLGASGARLCTTALLEMRRRGARRALVSLCVGVGQGLALGLERVS